MSWLPPGGRLPYRSQIYHRYKIINNLTCNTEAKPIWCHETQTQWRTISLGCEEPAIIHLKLFHLGNSPPILSNKVNRPEFYAYIDLTGGESTCLFPIYVDAEHFNYPEDGSLVWYCWRMWVNHQLQSTHCDICHMFWANHVRLSIPIYPSVHKPCLIKLKHTVCLLHAE